VLDAVLSLLHHDPAVRPTMAEAERLLTDLTTARPIVAIPARKAKAPIRFLILVVAVGAAIASLVALRRRTR
jgi:hypothetical protein